MSEPRPLTAIIADFDLWVRRALGTSVIEAGFEVAAEAANVLDVLNESSYLHPSVVVLTSDSLGINSVDILHELREQDPPAEIVLVSPDLSGRAHAQEIGVHEVVLRGEHDQLLKVLLGLREQIETGERRRTSDRRSGADRRKAQDWSKVTIQRRSGEERRKGPRRKDDQGAPDPDRMDLLDD